MHTDRYLHFSSHHPASAKRAAVRSLFDRARNVTLRKENLREEEHICAISSSIQEPSTPLEEEEDEEPDDEGSQEDERKPPLAVIPYVSGVSERIRKACKKFDLRVVFKLGPCNSPLTAHQSEGPPPQGETGRCGLPDPLPLW